MKSNTTFIASFFTGFPLCLLLVATSVSAQSTRSLTASGATSGQKTVNLSSPGAATNSTVEPSANTSSPGLSGTGSPFTGSSLVTGATSNALSNFGSGVTTTTFDTFGNPISTTEPTSTSLLNQNNTPTSVNNSLSTGTGTIVPVTTASGTTNTSSLVLNSVTGSGTTTSTTATQTGNTIDSVTLSQNALVGLFNTVANPFNFLELVNISNQSITGSFAVIDFNGVGRVQEFTLAAQRRQDFDIHSLVGTRMFGHILVDFQGSTGAIVGDIAQYSGTAQNLQLQSEVPLQRVVQ